MAKEKRASWFKLFLHQKPMMDAVDDATLGKAIKAAMAYFETGEITDLDPLGQVLFLSMKPYVEESLEDYEKKAEAGKKGGRPKKQTKPEVISAFAEKANETEADADAEAEAEAEADTEAEEEAKAYKEAINNNNNKGAYRAQTACDFIPPSAQEVMDYCVQEGIYMNIPRFMDYHNATGWRRGNYQVTDWRPLVSYWLDGQAQLERQGRLQC
jgi:hypothetical protein